MAKRIVIIQGHPDASRPHFGHALAQAYADGAAEAGHEVRRIEIAQLDFPLLRSSAQWHDEPVPANLVESQEAIRWAQHLLLLFPLWMGDMPALLKGYLEQVLRPGFAIGHGPVGPATAKALRGRSARVLVTMGMPALVYRCYFGAHSLKSLERNILGMCGVAPVRETLVGMVEGMDANGRAKWLAKLHGLGREAQ